jgi:hypothetical protein
MRTIEKKMNAAVNGRYGWRLSNTEVYIDNEGGVHVYLHSNEIYKEVNGRKYINLCGWNTPTTRSRLRSLGVDLC